MPTISTFTGINNVADRPEEAGPGDLQIGMNAIINDSGSIVRRDGFTRVIDSTTIHSINSESGTLVFVDDTNLVSFDGTPTVVLAGLTAGLPMEYLWLNGALYFSNGAQNGVLKDGVIRSFGLDCPPSPVVANYSGGLVPGFYQVALTYLRNDGQESGTSTPVMVNATLGGFQITQITDSADPDVVGVIVYTTGVGGEVGSTGLGLRRTCFLPTGVASHIVNDPGSNSAGVTCATFGTQKPPLGTRMFFYRGLLYIVDGAALYNSQPMMFENFNYDTGLQMFPAPITMSLPLENGIWIGTGAEFMFLSGKDPYTDGGFTIKSRTLHGCAKGGVFVDSTMMKKRFFLPGMLALWVAACGVCVGDGNGVFEVHTASRWAPPSIVGRFGTVDKTDGRAQYVYGLLDKTYVMNISNGSVMEYDKQFNSAAQIGSLIFGADAVGLHVSASGPNIVNDIVGATETPITAEIDKGGLNFGSNYVKNVTEMYVHMRSAGQVIVTLRSGNLAGPYTTPIPALANILGTRGHKIRLPRGVRGKNMEIYLRNIDGAYFEISELETVVAVSSVRHGRQCHG